MNKSKKQFIFAAIMMAVLCISYYGCGTDTTTNTTPSTPPSIRMKQGSTYDFTYDSLTTSQTIRLPRKSHDVVQSQVVFSGKTCFPVISTTTDTVTHNLFSTDTSYYSYDSSGGKFYQYGISKLINPAFGTATWDLVADFTVAQGTSWTVGTVNYIVNIGGMPYTFTGPLTSKVAEKTTIQTTSNPSVSIDCYRCELYAHIVSSGTITVSADVYVEYYIGYASTAANPSGLVEVKLMPFAFVAGGSTLVTEPGDDRKLQSFTIAP